MKIYILGVPEKYRGKNLESRLTNFGLEFLLVEGIDGASLNEDASNLLINQSLAQAQYGRKLTNGEACCTIGHAKIAKKFLESNEDWALVLEDDVILDENFNLALDQIEKELHTISLNSIIQLSGYDFVDKYPLKRIANSSLVRLVTGGYTTSAYILGRNAAETILKHSDLQTTFSLADWPFHWRWMMHFYKAKDLSLVVTYSNSLLEEERSWATQKGKNLKGLPALYQSLVRTIRSIKEGGDAVASFRGLLMLDLESFAARQIHKIVSIAFSKRRFKKVI
jgi:glycosyl transferase family 25